MSSGCPVIASNIPSLQERCGDAALYVDPENPDEIADRILTLMNDDTLRTSLIERGRERGRQFTWLRTAREHANIIRKVLERWA